MFLLDLFVCLFVVCIAVDGLSIEEQEQEEKREGGAGEGKKVVGFGC